MTNNTIEIGTISIINSSLASLASQIEEVMKSRDEKIAEISINIETLDADILKRETEISKKQEKLAALKEKRSAMITELDEFKGISNPFEKVATPVAITTPIVAPVVIPIKIENKNTLPISTSFTGKALPAYDGKNDLRVKHPDGRMCFIKEGEAEVGKEYLFDVLNEGSYGTSYKVKALSEVSPIIVKESNPIEEVKEDSPIVENSNTICYSSGEEIKNTPFAKLFANMKK